MDACHDLRPACSRVLLRVVLASAITVASVAMATPRARADALEGTVELVEAGRVLPGAGGAVVSYEPEAGAPRPAPRTIEVDTRGKRFLPRVSVVARGSSVAFPNRDPIFHNVFSVSPANRYQYTYHKYTAGSPEIL